MENETMDPKLAAAIKRGADYKAQIRQLPASDAMEIFALAAVIKGTIERNPRLGPHALTLVSCDLAVEMCKPVMEIDVEVEDEPGH